MNTRSLIATLSVCATVAAVAAFLSSAGPLSPPAGPIAPTNKTLQEVEPRIAVSATNTPGSATALFVISQPGSYYLTGNITGVKGKNGVEIAASNVTLDLNGFALFGVAGSLDGVRVSVAATGVAVLNGTVAGWGGDGVIVVNASKSTIRLVRAESNGLGGLRIGADSVVDACVASGNASTGIVADRSCSILSSTAADNGGNGISASIGSVIVACAARNNAFTGISASIGAHVSQSTARGNSGDGFSISDGGVISGCSASGNGGSGVVAGTGVTIVDNAASFNTGDGIRAATASLVRGNACDNNGNGAGDGAGVHVIGIHARVENNNVIFNDRGIDVDVVGNLIIGNSASGNTVNYDIVASNKVGVIVVAPNSVAISGSTGGAGVGTTDPWANLSF